MMLAQSNLAKVDGCDSGFWIGKYLMLVLLHYRSGKTQAPTAVLSISNFLVIRTFHTSMRSPPGRANTIMTGPGSGTNVNAIV